jgi:hypothetical protein
MRGLIAAVSIIALAAAAFLGVAPNRSTEAALFSFDVGLSGGQEVPPVSGPGSGLARFTFDDVTRQLQFSVTVSGLSPNLVTAAHIHRGAAGVNGPIIHNLSTTGFTQVSGTLQLSEADVADLRAGNLYVNVHSVEHPGGFARGQMFLSSGEAVQASFRAAIEAYNRKSPAFFSFFTDAGIMSTFGFSRAEALEIGSDFFEGPPLVVRSFNVVSAGSQPVTDAEIVFGAVIDRLRFHWVLEGGIWKVNAQDDLPEIIPSGTRTVEVRGQEFAFVYDRSAFSTGNVAIDFRNVGRQEHELILVKIERPESLQAILQSSGPDDEGPPPGIIDIGGVFAEPGERTSMVFTQSLAAGRYGMLCFIPDPASDTPHAFLGMISEFTVGPGAASGGGGTITAPRTGDAGLAGTGGYEFVAIAALLALSLSGFATLALMSRRS